MKDLKITTVAALSALSLTSLSAQSLQFLSSNILGEGAGEVVSYTDGTLAVTNNPAGGVSLFSIDNSGSFNSQVDVNFSGYGSYTGGFVFDSVTSVAIDSRGFGFAAIQGATAAGKMGVFNTSTGAILGTYDVGNNPDMVRVAGNRALFANEGEFGASGTFTGATDTAGSVSYFDYTGATNAANVISSLSTETQVGFSSFTDAALNSAGIRRHATDYSADQSYNNLEPEYIAVSGNKAFVTLQENNAIAVINLDTNTVESINDLGIATVTVDASDKNGVAVDDVVKGLVMPDTVEIFETGGKTYVVVGSEGDARGDDADIERAGDYGTGLDATFAGTNPDGLTIDLDDNTGVGRVDIVLDLSDPDSDNDIDDIITLSSRSVHVYEYVGGATGLTEVDMLEVEAILAALDPARHNSNDGGLPGEVDKRSDNKGHELEALDVAEIDGQLIAAVAGERSGAIFLVDLSDPENVSFITGSYENGQPRTPSLISPETMQFATLDGEDILIVGFEGESGVAGGVGIYRVVPEPSAYAALAGLVALGLVAARRRR